MDYEKTIKEMEEALVENVGCGYAKDFIKHDTLKDGKIVRVSLLVEIETGDPLD